MWFKRDGNDIVVQISFITESTDDGWIETTGEALIGWTHAGGDTFTAPSSPNPTNDDVNAERDRRKHLDITLSHDGSNMIFQADEASQRAIHEAAVWALKAIDEGSGDADDYVWNSNTSNFQWILADNSLVNMDAPEVVALWGAVSKRNHELVHKARTLKDTPGGIPSNYTDESHWT